MDAVEYFPMAESLDSLKLPFSEAVRVGPMLYLSGAIGIDDTGALAAGGIEAETRQALANIRSMLERHGSSMDRVIKCTAMLADMGEWPAMNRIYLEYCELLMQAKEYGAGYRVEWEDTLYIAPTPIVSIDNRNSFHSETGPAIHWKGGCEFYYLKGENFDRPLWKKIVDQTITAEEVMGIEDTDQREIALSLLRPDQMLKELKAELLGTGSRGTKLYKLPNFRDRGENRYAIWMKDPGTPREFIEGVPAAVAKQAMKIGEIEYCQSEAYKDKTGNSMPLEDYLLIVQHG